MMRALASASFRRASRSFIIFSARFGRRQRSAASLDVRERGVAAARGHPGPGAPPVVTVPPGPHRHRDRLLVHPAQHERQVRLGVDEELRGEAALAFHVDDVRLAVGRLGLPAVRQLHGIRRRL